MSEAPITLREMIREAKRELNLRRSFYPKRIADGRMNAREGWRQIDVQVAIIETLIQLQRERGEDDPQGRFID